MNKKNKLNYKYILYVIAIFFFSLTLCRANLMTVIKPFGFGFGFALVLNNIYPIFAVFFTFIGLFLQNFSINGAITSASTCAVLILFYLVVKLSKNKKTYLLLIFCAVSRVANIYFMSNTLLNLTYALAEVIVGTIFCYIYHKLVFAITSRNVQALTRLETMLGHFVMFALFCGLSNINIFGVDWSKAIYLFSILVLSFSLKYRAVSVVLFMVLAKLSSTLSAHNVILYFLAMTSCLSLSGVSKFVISGIVMLIDAAIIYISAFPAIAVIPTALAIFIFLFIPNSWYKNFADYLLGAKKSVLYSYISQYKQNQIKNKLLTMSMMFDEMQKCYRELIISSNDFEDTKRLFVGEIKTNMCTNCINKLNCYNSKDMGLPIAELFEKATDHPITLIDVPNILASNCNRLSSMILATNLSVEEYKKNLNKIRQDAESKLGVSLQYAGTSQIFKELSSQFFDNGEINVKKSKDIKDMSTIFGIVCKECIAIEQNGAICRVLMIVRSVDSVNPDLLCACKKVYNIDFKREDCALTKYSGWSLVNIVPSENFELQCGIATNAKIDGEVSGDNYIFSKISTNKYLVAISDGMGHGKEANYLSDTAVRLVESFYKCGFDSGLVVDSLNNLLLPISTGYTTLDVSVVDIVSGKTDFIKLGSSISVVKQNDQSRAIGVESLPVGTVEVANPTFTSITLFSGNVVVMASDGVVDAFGYENFCNYVNNENIINMQFFANEILEEANSRVLSHKDDMTVIAYKLAQKR